MIKAVIFDVDGVLIDSFDANLKFYQDLLHFAGYPPPTREQFAPLFHINMFDAIKAFINSESEEEVQKIWQIVHDRVVPYPIDLLKTSSDAAGIITELSKDYKIGIVTARVRNGIFEIPSLARLKKYFDVVIAYEDTTNHKPDPEPLLLASEKLEVKPNDCVYVGDTLSDIQASRAAGMKAIAYPVPLAGSDVMVSSFSELPDAILKL